MKNIKKFTLQLNGTIRDALKKIDQTAVGCVFVVDEHDHLQGIITDGDVRRCLLKGNSLESPISKVINRHPLFAYEGASGDLIKKILGDKKIKILPIVSKKKVLLDFVKYDQSVHFPVAQPVFEGNELQYVTDAVLSGWVSSVGSYITKFEEAFAKFCDVKYAVACSNGTTALQLALLALDIGPGDEVIVPSLTFIASANAVRHVGAKPILVDVEKEYWQIDPSKIELAITARTKAVIPVHLYGHPAQMDEINKIAKRHKLFVIEDAAEATGAEVRGKKVGAWGDVATFSFYGNKIITTGEGGMVTTNDEKLAKKMLVLRDHGMSKERRYWHDVLGYNFRMTNLQAALGLAQLERIDKILKRKQEIARWYKKYLGKTPGLTLQREASWAKNVYWMFSVLVKPADAIKRNTIMKKLSIEGVDTRPFFVPIHQQPIYPDYEDLDLPESTSLSVAGINLPSSVNLTEKDIALIARKVKKVLQDTK